MHSNYVRWKYSIAVQNGELLILLMAGGKRQWMGVTLQ